jgi:acetyl-CoA carboxylase biotin carboxylase subunit
MFAKILIANRGEIAVRIIRACRELEIKTIAVYSEADRDALHVKYADECYCIGSGPPAQSYLDINKIIKVAKDSASEAIHPGYGFLAQIPSFAKASQSNNIEFIGPSSDVLKRMGNKVMARKIMANAKVPVIPGSMNAVKDEDDVAEVAKEIGYPVLVKAVFGGGGKGMRIIKNKKDIPQAVEMARLEAKSSFGSSEIYVEKLLTNPKHIEFQLIADKKGNIIHLGERECSIQRKYQKLIEETPSPMMTEELRNVMGKTAIQAAKAINYTSVGTIEFLVNKEGSFYFLEMNTRLQVEHLITEMVTGVDIVKEQIKIAAGKELSYKQSDITMRGHAINCRINSEDPYKDFVPCPGTITEYHSPGGFGIRVDSALYAGYIIPVFYDSLIAKLAAWGMNRDEALKRMKNALNEYHIEGIETTIPLHKRILEDECFKRGEIHTRFVKERIGSLAPEEKYAGDEEEVAALFTVFSTYLRNRQSGLAVIPQRKTKKISLWRMVRRRR